jgi:hypothetical protein
MEENTVDAAVPSNEDDISTESTTSMETNTVEDAVRSNEYEVVRQKKRRGGKSADLTFWQSFTDDPDSHKAKSALCKHCRCRINHDKKLQHAMKHLNACRVFCNIMNSTEVDDHPLWYSLLASYHGKKRPKIFAGGQVVLSSTATTSSPASRSSIASSLTRTSYSMKDHFLPKLNAATQDRFDEAMVMNYYVTGTSFSRIEDEHLAAAIKILCSDAQLPSRRKLSGPLLQKAYSAMKKRVDKHLQNDRNVVCLTTDG